MLYHFWPKKSSRPWANANSGRPFTPHHVPSFWLPVSNLFIGLSTSEVCWLSLRYGIHDVSVPLSDYAEAVLLEFAQFLVNTFVTFAILLLRISCLQMDRANNLGN